MQISRFFLNKDIKGAIEYMRNHDEIKDVLPAYTASLKSRVFLMIFCFYIKSISAMFLLRLIGRSGGRQTADSIKNAYEYAESR